MSEKELIFKNDFLEINAEEGTSPFGCEIATMAIMLGSHFNEGRSNAFFIIENDSELELFLNDMKSIGLDTEDL